MQPTVNVNLKSCSCEPGTAKEWTECSAAPVLIPCPIPRSVTFEVRLGECTVYGHHLGGCYRITNTQGEKSDVIHVAGCPARSVRVSCSISGETWGATKITDFERADGQSWSTDIERVRVWDSVGARWILLEALVLGHTDLSALLTGPKALEMLVQRDAVYAALAKARRMEDGLYDALGDLPTGIASVAGRPVGARFTFAEQGLAAYVSRLVEQVGVMT